MIDDQLKDEQRWVKDDQRRDGLKIVAGVGGYVIMPGKVGLPVASCPCCDKPFPQSSQGLREAKLVAEMLYPLVDIH